jgi:hypothetical protein
MRSERFSARPGAMRPAHDSVNAHKLCAGCVAGVICVLVLRWLAGATAAPSPVGSAERCDLSAYVASGTAIGLAALDLKDCGLSSLPASIIQFVSLKKLDLGRNALTDLPPLPQSLEILFLLSNRFTSTPASISALPRLRMLSFKSNQLAAISTPLPTSIEWLILTDNQLTSLPPQVRAPFLFSFPTPLWRARKHAPCSRRMFPQACPAVAGCKPPLIGECTRLPLLRYTGALVAVTSSCRLLFSCRGGGVLLARPHLCPRDLAPRCALLQPPAP